MALYERTTSGSNYVYKLIETPIYGSEMIGVMKLNINLHGEVKQNGTNIRFVKNMNVLLVDGMLPRP